jgi:hypothetical protein
MPTLAAKSDLTGSSVDPTESLNRGTRDGHGGCGADGDVVRGGQMTGGVPQYSCEGYDLDHIL